MANNFSKNDKGINIEPSTVAGTAAGDLRIDSAASNVPKFHDGSSEDVLVRRTATETLTNKTIVAASNTITTAATGNLAAVELNGALAELQSDIDGREPAITTLSIAKGGTNSGTALNNNRVMQSSGSAIVEAAAITASRAVVSDANGIPVHATTTAAEIGYVNGVTSAIQTQLDAKAPIASPSFTGDITLDGQASTPSTPSSGYYKAYVKDSTGKLTILNSAGTETAVGGGSGGINLIGDGADAEAGTTGWSTFADAASSRPADGTGGSANVTWTTSSTAPLYGVNSFVFTKDASNRQGEGVSYAFTVSTAHQAKVLQVSFDYIVGSGTFVAGSSGVDSDLIAYIYDVTNSTLIELSSFKLLSNSTTIADRFNATFQTSATGTSYRLILYCATTSASAYTVKFDNISVSPSTYIYGTPITDWQSFTPTGSWSTNTTYTGKWRRVGDSMELDALATCSGAPTATAVTFSLPSGYTIDTSKLTGPSTFTSNLGIGFAYNNGVGSNPLNIWYKNTTTVNASVANSAGTWVDSAYVTSTAPFTFGSTDTVHVKFSVPILGWSSSVQTSDQTDTRVVAAKAKLSANQTGVSPNNSYVKINFNSVTASSCFDTHGAYDTSAYRYNVPVSGKYRLDGLILIANTNVLNNRYLVTIRKNGYDVFRGDEKTQAANTYVSLLFSGLVDVVVDDYLEVYIYGVGDNSASNLIITTDSHLNVSRISGPSAIAASESITVKAYDTAGTTINSSNNTKPFATEVYDSHGAFDGSTGIFTAPISGKYHFDVNHISSSTLAASDQWFMLAYKNASTIVAADVKAGTGAANTYNAVRVSGSIDLLAEETLQFNSYTGAATLTLTSTSGYNQLSIHRVGN